MGVTLLQSYRHGAAAVDLLAGISWHTASWASDPLWTPPADGGAVSSWRGAFGSRDWTQGTGSAQPLYRASVATLDNRPAIEFDGTDDYLETPTFTGVADPCSMVVVGFRRGAGGGGNERVIRHGASGQPCILMNYPAGGKWGLHGDGGSFAHANNYDTNGHLLVATFNGASSYIGVDGSNTTGSSSAANITDLRLAYGSVAGDVGKITVAFAGFYVGDVGADAGWAAWKADVASYYGLTIA